MRPCIEKKEKKNKERGKKKKKKKKENEKNEFKSGAREIQFTARILSRLSSVFLFYFQSWAIESIEIRITLVFGVIRSTSALLLCVHVYARARIYVRLCVYGCIDPRKVREIKRQKKILKRTSAHNLFFVTRSIGCLINTEGYPKSYLQRGWNK